MIIDTILKNCSERQNQNVMNSVKIVHMGNFARKIVKNV